jgi:hypothetical protein
MLPAFVLAIFLSAGLLFLVQPMAAKAVLPILGGAPAVWNTSMLFFQAALLAGYAYAHAVSRLSIRVQVALQCIVLVGAGFALPLAMRMEPPQDTDNPQWWVIRALALMVGLPFFAVSTVSPLLQRWFSATDHPHARDPYFLYAASNAGSMLGLLSYPFLIEPTLTLAEQRGGWSVGFGALAVLIIVAGVLGVLGARRATRANAASGMSTESRAHGAGAALPRLSARRVAWWLLLAFIPSSLLLGVTQHISTDIASIPLLWVIPLSLYLLSFILAFSPRVRVGSGALGMAMFFAMLATAASLFTFSTDWKFAQLGVHVLAFTIASWMCHRMLAEDRPHPSQLTLFYLVLSAGGVLGGILNGLIAPVVFESIAEYPIVLAIALLVAPLARAVLPRAANAVARLSAKERAQRKADDRDTRQLRGVLMVALAVAAAAAVVVIDRWVATTSVRLDRVDQVMIRALPVTVAALAVALAIAPAWGRVLLAGGLLGLPFADAGPSVLLRERTFFGVHVVAATANGQWHILKHGTTLHGIQSRVPELAWVPTTYYHPSGPIGDLLNRLRDAGRNRDLAFVGMGAGTLAAYGERGMHIRFYEIDKSVVEIAADDRFFTYLKDSKAKISLMLGDARVQMMKAEESTYDAIVLDAFSSDAIPVHLLTLEAFRDAYLPRIKKDGVIAVHISNRYFNLGPPLGRIARELGLVAYLCEDGNPTDVQQGEGKRSSTWVVIAREPSHLAGIDSSHLWGQLVIGDRYRLWTDDYANFFQVLHSRSKGRVWGPYRQEPKPAPQPDAPDGPDAPTAPDTPDTPGTPQPPR